MADKKKEKQEKPELEREYIIPLRKKVQKVPRYRRAKKAIKVIKEFLAKNMKVEDRDLNKIKIDRYLNQEIWFRGIKNPPAKIKVKAVKKQGTVYAELVDIPEKVKWDIKKEEKLQKTEDKTKQPEKKEEEPKEQPTEDTKEKEKASVEAGLKSQKQQAIQQKHTAQTKQPKQTQIHRKALKK